VPHLYVAYYTVSHNWVHMKYNILNLPLTIAVTVPIASHSALSSLIISHSATIHWSLARGPMLNAKLFLMGYGYKESCRELFKELKILTTHHSIYSVCYCSLLIIGITLFQIVYLITLIPDGNMIYTCLRYLWPCIRREFIIQALKFLTVFLQ
jgi:hypothetical protein